MSTLHKEINFENDLCNHLSANGWLYAEGDAASYSRSHALFPADLIAWVQTTQPKAWETLTKNQGAAAEATLLDRIRKQLDNRGTLDVLRHGIELLGLRQPLQLAQFKPALAMNPDLQVKYSANRLRVIRQVKYSLHNENSIDLVLFLNGIPVATVELKSNFTQSVEDAVDQYRFDRQPRPKGQNGSEPLLDFPRGALVHFAVSNSEVMMTTHLQGTTTKFLPFNQGDDGAAGNPPSSLIYDFPPPFQGEGRGGDGVDCSNSANHQNLPHPPPNLPLERGGTRGGHRTAYLWEQVWERGSWLEIIGRYLVTKRNSMKQLTGIIFPRFHQLDATRKLLATVLEEGAGHNYLIQHSAGSGKTNSIAWTAHFLADLHNANNKKMFDTVLVVSDRTVLDDQLQEAIFDFERTVGVVATITGENVSKSGELAKALSGNKKIVVCTIQTFPFALQAVQELAATKGKQFAVIADEAHSSQTGEAASKLKAVLTAEELKGLKDGDEISTEDILVAQMSARANVAGITYVAFTATPKAKTLELFGRRPNSDLPVSKENLPAAFHVYSMRQAIEEGFILDVLKNYTPYNLAFKLATGGKEFDQTEVERDEALKGIMRWVRLHPYNISQKVQIVVEHFRENVAPLLNGQAKAMVVVGSRLEAVRWKIALDKYIMSQKECKVGTLVAFSGEVNDKESGPDPFSETSKTLNPNLKGRDIRKAFDTEEYQILLVANKFQTGFDQPLLCGMYVDKRLAGIQAVQTLSRLNRAHPGKETTYILDFVNDPAEVLASFKPYYQTAELAGVTDPNLVYDLRAKLDATGYYDDNEVERVITVDMNPKASQAELSAALEPVADRLLKRYNGAWQRLNLAKSKGDKTSENAAKNEVNVLILFKRNLGSFQRVYSFLSQIFDYGNSAIEKRAIFYRRLLPLLDFGRQREGVDLSKVVLTHHKLKDEGTRNLSLEGGDKLKPITDSGSGQVREKEKLWLATIIAKVNEIFGAETTDGDKLAWLNTKKEKLLEKDVLVQQALSNTEEQFAGSPDLQKFFMDALIESYSAQNALDRAALNSTSIQADVLRLLLGPAHLWDSLRHKGATDRMNF